MNFDIYRKFVALSGHAVLFYGDQLLNQARKRREPIEVVSATGSAVVMPANASQAEVDFVKAILAIPINRRKPSSMHGHKVVASKGASPAVNKFVSMFSQKEAGSSSKGQPPEDSANNKSRGCR